MLNNVCNRHIQILLSLFLVLKSVVLFIMNSNNSMSLLEPHQIYSTYLDANRSVLLWNLMLICIVSRINVKTHSPRFLKCWKLNYKFWLILKFIEFRSMIKWQLDKLLAMIVSLCKFVYWVDSVRGLHSLHFSGGFSKTKILQKFSVLVLKSMLISMAIVCSSMQKSATIRF